MSDTLRIVENLPSIFYTPILATVCAGFLEDEGYEGVLGAETQGLNNMHALNEGLIHVLGTAPSAGFTWLEKGESGPLPVQVATCNHTDGFFIVSREPFPVFGWSDLKGQSVVSVNFSPQPMASLCMLLRQRNIDPAEVNWLDDHATMLDSMEAFKQGEGDFLHIQQPHAFQLEEDGIGSVVASVGKDLGSMAFSTLAMSRNFINWQTEAAKAFMRAYAKCRHWIQLSPAENIVGKVEHLFPDFSHRAMVKSVESYKHIGAWRADPRISESEYDRMVEMWIQAGLMKEPYPYNRMVYGELAEEMWQGE